MSRRGVAAVALCGTVVLAAGVAAQLGFGARNIDTTKSTERVRAMLGTTSAPVASASLRLPVQVASAGLILPLPETPAVRAVSLIPASDMPPMQTFGDAAPLPEQAEAARSMPLPERTYQLASAGSMPLSEMTPVQRAPASSLPPSEAPAKVASVNPVLPPEAAVKAASATPLLPAETPPEHVGSISATPPAKPLPSLGALMRVASVNPNDPLPDDARPRARVAEIPNECLVAQICIDEYLWALYQRAPKLDTAKVLEKIKVTVKRKGKLRTVTKTIAKYVPQDFTWKDPIAAQKANMPLMEYVIGGMDRRFRTKLYHALRTMDEAGLEPGITSAFRDDYRQAIATGNKASSDSSFHGGSRRGGYGHGMAIDIVSVKGETRMQRFASSELLWKWIDEHEKELGVGRPYLDRDPPHIAPRDGREYAAKRGRADARRALLEKKQRTAAAKFKRQPAAVRSDPAKTKPAAVEQGKTKRANDDAKAKRAGVDQGKAKRAGAAHSKAKSAGDDKAKRAKTASSKARSI